MSLAKINSDIKDIEKTYREMIEKIGDSFQETVEQEMQTVLAPVKGKLLEFGYTKITWTQYTPYFNDGDECVFSTNFGDFYFEKEKTKRGRYYHENCDESPYSEPTDKDSSEYTLWQTSQLLVSSELGNISSEVWKTLGDHSRVIYDIESGVLDVEEYSHD